MHLSKKKNLITYPINLLNETLFMSQTVKLIKMRLKKTKFITHVHLGKKNIIKNLFNKFIK